MAKEGGTIAELVCPAPLSSNDTVLLGHGSGGRLSADLVRDLFLPAFRNPALARLDDQAIVNIQGARVAFTTDSFVVKPLFFPGGRYWISSRSRHRQRPRHGRRGAPVPECRLHH